MIDKPEEDLLLTILRISDLHIGELDARSGDAKVSNLEARLFARYPWFDGLRGHHAQALEELHAFYWKLVDDGEKPLLFVTGDVTQLGGGREFDTADDFLVSQLDLNPPTNRWVGLRCNAWRKRAIPGNHDHWSGLPVVWGGPHADFSKYFSEFSSPSDVPPILRFPLSRNRVLQVVRIDTDADVSPWGLRRLRAVGSFQSQLTRAEALLGPHQDGQIRVLMMHHSWDKRGFFLSIDKDTREKLEEFLVSTQTQVVLTGHTHEPLLQSFIARHKGESQNVLECRCGTTTQNDDLPVPWRSLIRWFLGRPWPANSLLLHRLYPNGKGVRWKSMSIMRKKTGGFSTVLGREKADL